MTPWIKMRTNLWDDPRVAKVCDMTEQSEAAVIGAMYYLWATADQHTQDGVMQGMSLTALDRKTGVKGFGQAMVSIGWLQESEAGIVVAKFDDHNSASAKARSQTAKRVQAHRAGLTPTPEVKIDPVTEGALHERYKDVANALTRERYRERDIEKNKTSSSSEPVGSDDSAARPVEASCPHQKIINLYAKQLPMLNQPKTWGAERQKFLKGRWREVMTMTNEKGERKYPTEQDGLDFFERFFAYVAQSDFLTGKASTFTADLEWLVRPSNFAKVIDGKYENK